MPGALLIVGQQTMNGDVVRGLQAISQICQASKRASALQKLKCIAIDALVFASLMLFARWFQDINALAAAWHP